MRYSIIVCMFIMSGVTFADSLTKEVIRTLYKNGEKSAYEYIKNSQTPSKEDLSLYKYISEKYGLPLNQNLLSNTDLSNVFSVRMAQISEQLDQLSQDDITFLKRHFSSSYLAFVFYNFNKVLEDVRYGKFSLELTDIYKDEIQYRIYESFFSSIYLLRSDNQKYVCQQQGIGSNTFFTSIELGIINETNCNITFKDNYLFLPSGFDDKAILKLDIDRLNSIYNYWTKNIKNNRYLIFSQENYCSNNYQKNKYKLCFLMSLGAADFCSLPFWNELETKDSIRTNSEGWITSPGYNLCVIEYLDKKIGTLHEKSRQNS